MENEFNCELFQCGSKKYFENHNDKLKPKLIVKRSKQRASTKAYQLKRLALYVGQYLSSRQKIITESTATESNPRAPELISGLIIEITFSFVKHKSGNYRQMKLSCCNKKIFLEIMRGKTVSHIKIIMFLRLSQARECVNRERQFFVSYL